MLYTRPDCSALGTRGVMSEPRASMAATALRDSDIVITSPPARYGLSRASVKHLAHQAHSMT